MFNKRKEIEVRKIQSNAELDEVIRLNLAEWGAKYFGTEEAERVTRDQYKDPLRHTLIAVLDGTVIGTAGLVERDVYNVYNGLDIRKKNLGYCSRLVVHSDFRKQGIAKRLLIERENLAASLGFTNIFLLIVEKRDSDLCRMHIKNGWKVEEEKQIGGFGDCIILTKELPLLRLTASKK